MRPVDRDFLVCDDYGTGGLWAVITAPSADAISDKYPQLVVFEQTPDWMKREDAEQIKKYLCFHVDQSSPVDWFPMRHDAPPLTADEQAKLRAF